VARQTATSGVPARNECNPRAVQRRNEDPTVGLS